MVKKEKLSFDELLEQSLVKDEHKPYEVPSNWVWAKAGNITEIVGGGTPPTNVEENYDNGEIAWITPSDLSGYNEVYISKGKRNLTRLGLQNSSARLVPRDTVLLSTRAPIGYVVIANNELCTNQGFKSFLPSPIYKSKYLYYYLIQCKELLESFASGTTFLELSGKKVSQVPIPLPPLHEQQRIVSLTESLFQKLDRAKELVQEVLETFENRKAAILHKAFAGEFTAKWREENGVDFDRDWEEKKLNDICEKITDGFHNSPKPIKHGIPYIMAGHVKPRNIDFANCLFVDEKNHGELYKKAFPQKGDILLVNIGAGTGTPAVIEVDFEFSFKNCAIIKLKNEFNSCFVFYYLLYMQSRILAEITQGGAQPFLSLKIMKQIDIKVPCLQEQEEIVRILDNLLENEDKTKELCDVIEDIDLMKKSILARAFRGELNTYNPDEESALDLLKEILREKAEG